MAPRRRPVDPGEQQIDDLEHAMLLAHEQQTWSGAGAEELARFRSGVVALAKAVCDRLRAEHRARRQA